MRLPYRERFAILISEFGAGLAGRGEELNEVIHRANPALRETDQVLKILADQNRTLARLARDSDQVLAPLAREREHFADFIVQANATSEASAERSEDLRRGIELLPGFLRELAHVRVVAGDQLFGLRNIAGDGLVLAEPLDRRLELRQRFRVFPVHRWVALHFGRADQRQQVLVLVFDGRQLIKHILVGLRPTLRLGRLRGPQAPRRSLVLRRCSGRP